MAQLAVVVGLVVLAVMNISVKGWTEMEDGVLWVEQRQRRRRRASSPRTRRRAAPASSRATSSSRSTRSRFITRPTSSTSLHASHVRIAPRLRRPAAGADSELLVVPVAGIPSGTHWLYLALAGVGLFTLLVGTGVRLRRPENQATLHFFWLCVAFFGVLAFSFSGRLDLLDWVFYWGDVVAMLLLPPLFVHFALVFPERPDSWARSDRGRTLLPLVYLPALLLGGRQGRDDSCAATAAAKS